MIEYIVLDGKLSESVERDFLEMGRAAFEESSFNGMIEYDEQRMLEVARTYSEMDHKLLVLAVDGDGRTVGVFAGYSAPWYFSADSIARDVLWYVVEEHRSSGVGLMLLSIFEEWAKEMGAKSVWLGQDSGIDTSKFSRILEAKGYSFIGANYALGVN